MATFLVGNYSAALKEVLLPYIQDNFPKATILLDQMKRNSGVTHMNDEFIAPVRSARHGGVANLANDGNNINPANGASVTRGTVAVKTVTGAFNISKLAIDASAGKPDAVKGALSFQVDTLVSDFARHINRQLHADPTAVVGQVLGSVSGTVVSLARINASVDDGRVLDYYGSVNGDIALDKYFAPGQIIGIGTGAAAVGTISSIAAGTALNLTGATASAANDAIYILDGSGGGAGTSEFNGIREALSSTTGTSTYAGIARSVPGWTPRFGSTAQTLSLPAMETAYLQARENSQNGDRFAIFVNISLYRKYGDLLSAMRRTVTETDLLGGWTGLEFAAGAGKVGVFLDYDVPDGEVLIINLDTWTICQVSDLNWMEDPNQNSLLRLNNTITYQATMVWFANTMCLSPGSNAKLTQKTG